MGGMRMDPKQMQAMMAKRQKEMRDKLSKDLKMTPDQLKKYDALVKIESAARMKLFSGGQRPDRKVFDKMRADHDLAMKKILKADQFAKFQKIEDDMRKERMKRMGGMMGGGMRPGGAPPAGGGKG
jgi:hypothetical protein